MTELKKCPLCNSDCKILSTKDDDNYPLEHHIVYCSGENCDYDARDWRTLEEAISHHNSRPIENGLKDIVRDFIIGFDAGIFGGYPTGILHLDMTKVW
jgi:hypothetical protein